MTDKEIIKVITEHGNCYVHKITDAQIKRVEKEIRCRITKRDTKIVEGYILETKGNISNK